MRAVGDKKTGTIRPDFDRSISIDFQGAKITNDTGFLLIREIDQRFIRYPRWFFRQKSDPDMRVMERKRPRDQVKMCANTRLVIQDDGI